MIVTHVPQKEKIIDILHIIILCLSVFLVVWISIDTFNNISFLTQGIYLKIQFWICLFFLFDFVVELALADRKGRYFCTHFIFLIISIPYVNIIDYYQISLSTEVNYLIRFVPLIRGGYALANVVSWLTKNKISGLFVSYITILSAAVYFFSLMFFVLEHKVNPMVTNFSDSLWWAFMSVTTVGSDIYAQTGIGRILTVVLAALGMMMFPIFTVYITNIVQITNKKNKYSHKENSKTKKEEPGQS